MLSDENENFIRDIEIQATQTFQDFHDVISDCVRLNGNELASFHICDQKWQKMEEITLMDMGEDSERENKAIAIVAIMKDAVIRDYISEPNQRLLYEYDFLHMKTFFIELLSVFKQKEDAKYPRCTFKRSEVIDDFTSDTLLLDDDDEIRKQLYEDFEDLLDDTIEGYDESDF
jgi:hypothetical protein